MQEPRIAFNIKKTLGEWSLNASFSTGSSRLAVWGPSGAGKSVTLKAIAGLIKPDSGVIRIGGRTLFDSEHGIDFPPQKRRVGLMFQGHLLFPHLTVAGNLSFGLKRSKEARDEVRLMARKLEISHLLDRQPSQLSGGQCQRVALGRALLTKPDLLLLDEPFSSLGQDLRTKLRVELAELLERFDLPVILVTHDVEDIRVLADEVVAIADGVCSESVPLPEELLARRACEREMLCDYLKSHLPSAQMPSGGCNGRRRNCYASSS